MVYPLSERAPSASNLTAKNRVWGFFENSNRTRPANRRQPLETRRKNRSTPTKTASGIPYWPSRDPIEERGSNNLYEFVGNDSVNWLDYLGKFKMKWPDFISDVIDEFIPSYDKAIEEQGEIARKRAKDLMDERNDSLEDVLKKLKDQQENKPKPIPTPSGVALCEYSCTSIAKGTVSGIKACLFGECTLVRKMGGTEGVSCPAKLPGTIATVATKNEIESCNCDKSITTEKMYVTGRPLDDQTTKDFVYSGW